MWVLRLDCFPMQRPCPCPAKGRETRQRCTGIEFYTTHRAVCIAKRRPAADRAGGWPDSPGPHPAGAGAPCLKHASGGISSLVPKVRTTHQPSITYEIHLRPSHGALLWHLHCHGRRQHFLLFRDVTNDHVPSSLHRPMRGPHQLQQHRVALCQ